jgi:MFS family permease
MPAGSSASAIVGVALPTIQRELHMAAAQLQWIVTGSALTGATTGIVAGGVLTQYLGWRAVFLVNPIIAIMRRPAVRPWPRC